MIEYGIPSGPGAESEQVFSVRSRSSLVIRVSILRMLSLCNGSSFTKSLNWCKLVTLLFPFSYNFL